MSKEKFDLKKIQSKINEISHKAKQVGRVVAFLTREQIDFIDKISKDALFSTGKKLSRTEIIQAMVETIRKLTFSGDNVKTKDELETKMEDVAKEGLPELSERLKNLYKKEQQ